MNNNLFDLQKRTTPYIMLVIFSINDCVDCLMEAYMWEKIHENYSSNIKVIGIGYADNKRQLDIFLKHKKIKFPVWYDKDKKFLKYYNIKTPKRIVINIDNKIMIIENPTGSKFFQDMFMTELFSLINSSNNL